MQDIVDQFGDLWDEHPWMTGGAGVMIGVGLGILADPAEDIAGQLVDGVTIPTISIPFPDLPDNSMVVNPTIGGEFDFGNDTLTLEFGIGISLHDPDIDLDVDMGMTIPAVIHYGDQNSGVFASPPSLSTEISFPF